MIFIILLIGLIAPSVKTNEPISYSALDSVGLDGGGPINPNVRHGSGRL